MCGLMGPEGSKSDADYQAEDDLRTMQRHHALTSDPARHSKAKKLAAKQMKMLKKLSSSKGLSKK